MSKHRFSSEIDSINEMLVRVGKSGLVNNLDAAALLAYAIEDRWCRAMASLILDDDYAFDVFRAMQINPPLSNPEHRELIELLGLESATGDADDDTVVEDTELEEVTA